MTHTSSGNSSSSDSEVDSCSKSCVKAYATLKEQYDSLYSDYKKSQFNFVSYKADLKSVEARLSHYKKNEAVFEESINVLKLEVRLRDNALVENKKKLEKAEKERDELKLTLEKFQNSSKSLNNLLESQVSDKFKTGLGYNAATAASPAVESFVNSSEMLENQEYNRSKGYHAVPPPYTGNFIPRKPDLTFIDEIVESENMDITTVITPSDFEKDVSNHESAGVKNNGDAVEPKTVRENSFIPPIIEDWNSDDESEIDYTVRSSIEKIRFVKPARETVEKVQKIKYAVVTDLIGCSKTNCESSLEISNAYKKGYSQVTSHLTSVSSKQEHILLIRKVNIVRVKRYYKLWRQPTVEAYKEKGVINSGCSRHMTGNKCYLTEYEDCDGGFFLWRGKESQVLLRVPRKDNIYSVDLKSVVPTEGLTCLIAKATIDESNLWHKRLGHINFKNMNKLVRGNIVRVNELRAERMAKNANPLALVATAHTLQDPYYQTSKPHKSYAPTSKASLPTRSHATTRYKGKEIAKPITLPSESASE
ncbi:ribonuclease H-like domain-containing protein [Tanacetum coccineum]